MKQAEVGRTVSVNGSILGDFCQRLPPESHLTSVVKKTWLLGQRAPHGKTAYVPLCTNLQTHTGERVREHSRQSMSVTLTF